MPTTRSIGYGHTEVGNKWTADISEALLPLVKQNKIPAPLFTFMVDAVSMFGFSAELQAINGGGNGGGNGATVGHVVTPRRRRRTTTRRTTASTGTRGRRKTAVAA